MGCRTRVIGNAYDPTREIVTGRGNLSFTTINLPRLGIKAQRNIGAAYLTPPLFDILYLLSDLFDLSLKIHHHFCDSEIVSL